MECLLYRCSNLTYIPIMASLLYWAPYYNGRFQVQEKTTAKSNLYISKDRFLLVKLIKVNLLNDLHRLLGCKYRRIKFGRGKASFQFKSMKYRIHKWTKFRRLSWNPRIKLGVFLHRWMHQCYQLVWQRVGITRVRRANT